MARDHDVGHDLEASGHRGCVAERDEQVDGVVAGGPDEALRGKRVVGLGDGVEPDRLGGAGEVGDVTVADPALEVLVGRQWRQHDELHVALLAGLSWLVVVRVGLVGAASDGATAASTWVRARGRAGPPWVVRPGPIGERLDEGSVQHRAHEQVDDILRIDVGIDAAGRRRSQHRPEVRSDVGVHTVRRRTIDAFLLIRGEHVRDGGACCRRAEDPDVAVDEPSQVGADVSRRRDPDGVDGLDGRKDRRHDELEPRRPATVGSRSPTYRPVSRSPASSSRRIRPRPAALGSSRARWLRWRRSAGGRGLTCPFPDVRAGFAATTSSR